MNGTKPLQPKGNLAVSLPSAQTTGRGNFPNFGTSKVTPISTKQNGAPNGISDPAPSPSSQLSGNTQTLFPQEMMTVSKAQTQVHINLETTAQHESILFFFREQGHDLTMELVENLRGYWSDIASDMLENIDLLFDDPAVEKVFVSARVLEMKVMAIFHYTLYSFFEKHSKGRQLWTPQGNLAAFFNAEYNEFKDIRSTLQLIHLNLAFLAQKIIAHLSPNILANSWASKLLDSIKSRRIIPVKPDKLFASIRLNNQILSSFVARFTKSLPMDAPVAKRRGNNVDRSTSSRSIPGSFMALLRCPEQINLDDFKPFVLNFALRDTRSVFSKAETYFQWFNQQIQQFQMTAEAQDEAPRQEPIMPGFDNYKPPKEPFLPPVQLSDNKEHPYTLVLDMDETLIHYYEDNGVEKFRIRPGVEIFLEEMVKHYELVIFTAGMQDYADWILDQLPGTHHISHRLYRHHCVIYEKGFFKDLSKIGRDLSRTIIVDNNPENFRPHIENGIFIKTWIDDEKDRALPEIQGLLKQIATKKVKDVRKALQFFRDQILQMIYKGEKPPEYMKLD